MLALAVIALFGNYLRRKSPFKGRIDAALYVCENMKRPIILHRKHVVTKLIVAHYHTRYHHQNNETVIISNFMSRRGVPLQIYSDNGTNFKGVSRRDKKSRQCRNSR